MPTKVSKTVGPVHEEDAFSPDKDTLPKLLLSRLREHPDRKAMRVKDRGIWRSYTSREYFEKVKWFCLGLVSLGLKRGDNISIIGENKPEWYWAELAVQSAGGTAVGIFVDCTPSEVKYFVEHSDSRFVVAHDQEQVDKLLEIKNQVSHVKRIIYWDSKGMWGYEDPILMSFREVLELGCAYERERPDIFDELISQGKGEDIAVICYTSGTTGLPKGVMLSQRSTVAATVAWSKLDKWFGKQY
jgi:long-chain acyl-CoA synthetase